MYMNNILIYLNIVESGEYDIFNKTDVKKWNKIIQQDYSGKCFNTGNKLWFQGIISEISTKENILTYWKPEMKWEEINEKYDMVIAPMANIFSIGFKDLINRISARFEKIHIPIYVIACGVQADSYDDLDNLINIIGKASQRLMRAVYNSGGEFALRGYFTKEFFDKLGFNSAVVTGCPSLFQKGKNLGINLCRNKVSEDDFKVALNGDISEISKILRQYSKSVFFDQNEYYDLLNNQYLIENMSLRDLCCKYSVDEVLLACNDRIRLFPDMEDWMNYLYNQKFDFSFGSRIHGNIMPILAGIPSTVVACDSRTREMAEFFEIPMVKKSDILKKSVYEYYLNADYAKFSKSFPQKYLAFEQFLSKNGIVDQINCSNDFLKLKNESKIIFENKLQLLELKPDIEKNENKLRFICLVKHYIRKLRR